MISADWSSDQFSEMVAAGDGSFEVATPHQRALEQCAIRHGRDNETFPAAIAESNVVAIDMDGDGRLELITANEGSNDLSIIRRR